MRGPKLTFSWRHETLADLPRAELGAGRLCSDSAGMPFPGESPAVQPPAGSARTVGSRSRPLSPRSRRARALPAERRRLGPHPWARALRADSLSHSCGDCAWWFEFNVSIKMKSKSVKGTLPKSILF